MPFPALTVMSAGSEILGLDIALVGKLSHLVPCLVSYNDNRSVVN